MRTGATSAAMVLAGLAGLCTSTFTPAQAAAGDAHDGAPAAVPSTPAAALPPSPAGLATAGAAPGATALRPRVELSVRVDPEARRVSGTARWRIPNTGSTPLDEVRLWLYPNALGERPAGLGDVNFHWLYPRGFSPAHQVIRAVRLGSALTAGEAHLQNSSTGRDTVARVPLPAPVPPGGEVAVELDFDTELPDRLGGFGCAGKQCRMMGGFYPFPLHLGPAGWQEDLAPDRLDYVARVTAPAGADLVVGDTVGNVYCLEPKAKG